MDIYTFHKHVGENRFKIWFLMGLILQKQSWTLDRGQTWTLTKTLLTVCQHQLCWTVGLLVLGLQKLGQITTWTASGSGPYLTRPLFLCPRKRKGVWTVLLNFSCLDGASGRSDRWWQWIPACDNVVFCSWYNEKRAGDRWCNTRLVPIRQCNSEELHCLLSPRFCESVATAAMAAMVGGGVANYGA